MLKKPSFPFLFKRLHKKGNSGGTGIKYTSAGDDHATTGVGGIGGGDDKSSSTSSSPGGRRRFKNFSSGLRWKRKFTFHLWFVDGFLFKIVSVCEAIVLVSTFCVFFLCCGCHI